MTHLLLAGILLGFLVSPVDAQQPPQPGAPASDVSNIPKPITDTFDRVNIRNRPSDFEVAKKTPEKGDTCLLPPLGLISSPTIAAEELKIAAKARKEYQQACTALKNKKIPDGEKHLRKAVQRDPKYSAAWVTLGQVLAMQQRTEEGRSACLQGSIAHPGYTPAYLCLADIATRAHAWDEVLKLTGRALELDPSNFVAYEYDAAANLNLHNLAAAEKSALRAAGLDKDHHEPRVQFVLAQIYEAKGDPTSEATHLREYLKYADDPDGAAVAQHYLSKLEEKTGGSRAVDDVWRASTRRWAPVDIDDEVPPVRTDTPCPLPQILQETSKRTRDFLENLQRFSASERIEQIDIGKNGKSRTTVPEVVNYVAEVEENSAGYPTVKEYRYRSGGMQQSSVVDTSTAAFALIFHPTHIGNFDFRCEGLNELRASPAWQVRFEERSDESKPFHAMRVGRSVYLTRFKGRAWITTDSYQVVRIETDLVSPIPQIDLQLEHLVIAYAPVEFQKRHLRLWLPMSASLYMDYRGHRYERKHNFSGFQLFSVDAEQTVKEPNSVKDPQFQLLKKIGESESYPLEPHPQTKTLATRSKPL